MKRGQSLKKKRKKRKEKESRCYRGYERISRRNEKGGGGANVKVWRNAHWQNEKVWPPVGPK